ncbi:MAG: hypothetical protein C4547_06750 [Phycisphaerales bacterium]|nr:MAG: hypothetical protein C4547_06750 [Phycisphaerales bacterium]
MSQVRRIGIPQCGWWSGACRVAGIEAIAMPLARGDDGNPHSARIEARMQSGAEMARVERATPTDFWLDNGGAGLAFVVNPDDADEIQPVHEAAGRILVSHYIDPLVTCFQGMHWHSAWQCLQSRTWVKAVWDRAQAIELERFGVPHVIHLPMAAPIADYDTRPVDVNAIENEVSFVGAQNTSYFHADHVASTEALLPGTLAHAVHADLPEITFYDVYHDMYALAEPPAESDDLVTRAGKTERYFVAKLFYHASLCLRNRDRWIVFLKRRLGERFRLIGQRWDVAYGLDCEPPLPTHEAYLAHFRRTAVNLNFINGNAETGVNMRAFEITAAGGFLLCPYQPELEECFEIGAECDVFRTEEELLQKIEFYIEHPRRRIDVALAGQRRTLSQHLYSHRLETVLRAVGRLEERLRSHSDGQKTAGDAAAPRESVAGAAVGGPAARADRAGMSDRSAAAPAERIAAGLIDNAPAPSAT